MGKALTVSALPFLRSKKPVQKQKPVKEIKVGEEIKAGETKVLHRLKRRADEQSCSI